MSADVTPGMPNLRGRYSPADPVAYGAPIACPNGAQGVLSAVTGTNADLFVQVAALWIRPDDVVADLATGTDCRSLPYSDASIDVVAFDPPYQPMHGSPRRSFGGGGFLPFGGNGPADYQ